MIYIHRRLEKELIQAAGSFPAIILTGPRRSGKTTLLRNTFPDAEYHLLEEPDLIARFKEDPRSFIDELHPPVILDEIQNVPEIFNYIRAIIDRNPDMAGRWLLTGSQEAPLMQGVTESMAGRAAIFQLLPLSRAESSKVSMLTGGYPEVIANPAIRRIWFRSYIQTYLERDIRAISAIRDLSTFRRFMSILASRCGQLLNKTEMAAPLGVSVPTLTTWLNILEATAQIILLPPFYENFGKRLIKSPRLYFADTGLACHLLGIESMEELEKSPFLGPVFEGYVAAEITKHQINCGRARSLYYFRDRQGLEVDFILDSGGRRISLIEARATRTPHPANAANLVRLSNNAKGYDIRSYVVHRAPVETGLDRTAAALSVSDENFVPDCPASDSPPPNNFASDSFASDYPVAGRRRNKMWKTLCAGVSAVTVDDLIGDLATFPHGGRNMC